MLSKYGYKSGVTRRIQCTLAILLFVCVSAVHCAQSWYAVDISTSLMEDPTLRQADIDQNTAFAQAACGGSVVTGSAVLCRGMESIDVSLDTFQEDEVVSRGYVYTGCFMNGYVNDESTYWSVSVSGQGGDVTGTYTSPNVDVYVFGTGTSTGPMPGASSTVNTHSGVELSYGELLVCACEHEVYSDTSAVVEPVCTYDYSILQCNLNSYDHTRYCGPFATNCTKRCRPLQGGGGLDFECDRADTCSCLSDYSIPESSDHRCGIEFALDDSDRISNCGELTERSYLLCDSTGSNCQVICECRDGATQMTAKNGYANRQCNGYERDAREHEYQEWCGEFASSARARCRATDVTDCELVAGTCGCEIGGFKNQYTGKTCGATTRPIIRSCVSLGMTDADIDDQCNSHDLTTTCQQVCFMTDLNGTASSYELDCQAYRNGVCPDGTPYSKSIVYCQPSEVIGHPCGCVDQSTQDRLNIEVVLNENMGCLARKRACTNEERLACGSMAIPQHMETVFGSPSCFVTFGDGDISTGNRREQRYCECFSESGDDIDATVFEGVFQHIAGTWRGSELVKDSCGDLEQYSWDEEEGSAYSLMFRQNPFNVITKNVPLRAHDAEVTEDTSVGDARAPGYRQHNIYCDVFRTAHPVTGASSDYKDYMSCVKETGGKGPLKVTWTFSYWRCGSWDNNPFYYLSGDNADPTCRRGYTSDISTSWMYYSLDRPASNSRGNQEHTPYYGRPGYEFDKAAGCRYAYGRDQYSNWGQPPNMCYYGDNLQVPDGNQWTANGMNWDTEAENGKGIYVHNEFVLPGAFDIHYDRYSPSLDEPDAFDVSSLLDYDTRDLVDRYLWRLDEPLFTAPVWHNVSGLGPASATRAALAYNGETLYYKEDVEDQTPVEDIEGDWVGPEVDDLVRTVREEYHTKEFDYSGLWPCPPDWDAVWTYATITIDTIWGSWPSKVKVINKCKLQWTADRNIIKQLDVFGDPCNHRKLVSGVFPYYEFSIASAYGIPYVHLGTNVVTGEYYVGSHHQFQNYAFPYEATKREFSARCMIPWTLKDKVAEDTTSVPNGFIYKLDWNEDHLSSIEGMSDDTTLNQRRRIGNHAWKQVARGCWSSSDVSSSRPSPCGGNGLCVPINLMTSHAVNARFDDNTFTQQGQQVHPLPVFHPNYTISRITSSGVYDDTETFTNSNGDTVNVGGVMQTRLFGHVNCRSKCYNPFNYRTGGITHIDNFNSEVTWSAFPLDLCSSYGEFWDWITTSTFKSGKSPGFHSSWTKGSDSYKSYDCEGSESYGSYGSPSKDVATNNFHCLCYPGYKEDPGDPGNCKPIGGTSADVLGGADDCEHGTYNKLTSECECHVGWGLAEASAIYGTRVGRQICIVALCSADGSDEQCSGKGRCMSVDGETDNSVSCVCDEGWDSESLCSCPSNTRWNGNECETICPTQDVLNPCNGLGVCQDDGTCLCSVIDGGVLFGEECNEVTCDECSGDGVCEIQTVQNVHGATVYAAVCACADDGLDAGCMNSICPTNDLGEDCNGHGVCDASTIQTYAGGEQIGVCECSLDTFEEIIGDGCDIDKRLYCSEDGSSLCNNRGTCVDSSPLHEFTGLEASTEENLNNRFKCECSPGFSGEYCEDDPCHIRFGETCNSATVPDYSNQDSCRVDENDPNTSSVCECLIRSAHEDGLFRGDRCEVSGTTALCLGSCTEYDVTDECSIGKDTITDKWIECSGAGTCTQNTTNTGDHLNWFCACDNGNTGEFCETLVCDPPCENAECVTTETLATCECYSTFEPEDLGGGQVSDNVCVSTCDEPAVPTFVGISNDFPDGYTCLCNDTSMKFDAFDPLNGYERADTCTSRRCDTSFVNENDPNECGVPHPNDFNFEFNIFCWDGTCQCQEPMYSLNEDTGKCETNCNFENTETMSDIAGVISCDCYEPYQSQYNCNYDQCGPFGSLNNQTLECDCLEGYSGEDCTQSRCQGRGLILVEGSETCTCFWPYVTSTGENFDAEQQCDTTACMNGATTAFDAQEVLSLSTNADNWKGSCGCTSDFDGDYCEIPKCQNGGSVNAEHYTCVCPTMFTGEFCEESLCDVVHGVVVTEDDGSQICQCDPTRKGEFCDVVVDQCGTFGDWNEGTGMCDCDDLHTPDSMCALDVCEGRGTLNTETNECSCSVPFEMSPGIFTFVPSQPQCTENTCNAETTTDITSSEGCVCFSGWGGTTCSDITECVEGVVNNGVCSCDEGYTGILCEISSDVVIPDDGEGGGGSEEEEESVTFIDVDYIEELEEEAEDLTDTRNAWIAITMALISIASAGFGGLYIWTCIRY